MNKINITAKPESYKDKNQLNTLKTYSMQHLSVRATKRKISYTVL